MNRYIPPPQVQLAPPTTIQIAQSKALQQIITENNLHDTPESIIARNKVLDGITKLINRWIIEKTRTNDDPSQYVRVVPFGSTSMGLGSIQSDLDLLCCTTSQAASQSDFFSGLYSILNQDSHVSNLISAAQAYVPAIKFTYDNIQIDLLFASFKVTSFPSLHETVNIVDEQSQSINTNPRIISIEEQLLQNQFLTTTPFFSQTNHPTAANGIVNAIKILKLVQDANKEHGLELFIALSKLVKLWSKTRGVYSSVQGFLGGFSNCLLVVYLLQKYPNATIEHLSILFQSFFETFAQHQWPNPILVAPMDMSLSRHYPSAWYNPIKYTQMSIITPSFPYINTSYNVQISGKPVLLAEWKNASTLMTQIVSYPEPITADTSIATIIQHYTSQYKQLIFQRFNPFQLPGASCICISLTTRQLDDWAGFLESKIRLVSDDNTTNRLILRPYPKIFIKSSTKAEYYIFIANGAQPWTCGGSCSSFLADTIAGSLRRLTRDRLRYSSSTSISADIVSGSSLSSVIID